MFFSFGFCLFPTCSHQVSNVFLKMFSIALNIFISHIVWPWFIFHVYLSCKEEVLEGKHDKVCFNFWGLKYIGPHVPKSLIVEVSCCLFPMCSHQVSNVFSIALHFFSPYIVWPWFNFHVYLTCKEGAKGKHDKTCFDFGDQSILVPCCKSIVVGQSNSSLWEGKKRN